MDLAYIILRMETCTLDTGWIISKRIKQLITVSDLMDVQSKRYGKGVSNWTSGLKEIIHPVGLN
jgi:hypothetical protein